MGYAIPELECDRRAFWADFSRMTIYQQQMRRRWPVAAACGPKDLPPESCGAETEEAIDGEGHPIDHLEE